MSHDAQDFNKIETRSANKFLFLQGEAPKEIHAILTETLACLLPGRAKHYCTFTTFLASTLQTDFKIPKEVQFEG